MAKRDVTPEEREHAISTLRKYLGDGGTIFTITRYSKSGMSRWVRIMVPVIEPQFNNGQPDIVDITYYLSVLVSRTLDDDGLKFSGSGFDADSYIVQDLQRVLGIEPERSESGYRKDKIISRKLATYST